MPTLGLTMEQGTIARWLKREGDPVERDEPLFTVETDKATMDVPAPVGGVLARVLVPDGGTVPVLETIAIIVGPNEGLPEELAGAPAAPAQAAPDAADVLNVGAPAAPPAPVAPPFQRTRANGARPGWPASPRARRVAGELGVDLARVEGTGPEGRIVEADVRRAAAGQPAAPPTRVSPLAQRLALERGVNLASVAGTGPGGRITREDVEAAARAAAPGASAPAAAPAAAAPAPAPAAPAAAPAASGGRLAALSRLRRITAERMAQSARTVARVSLFTEVDFAEAVRFRTQLGPEFERRYGARLTYDTLVARACALAMAEHPGMNAHWSEQGPLLFEQVDVGVAVALPEGLTVPVVRDVARRPLWEVARAVNDVVARAQEGRLGPEDFGGTFTITNLGMYGVEGFTPIVNPPEVGILGVGAIQRKPVEVDGAVVVRERLTLSLAFDHRAIDGAPAAAFLARVREVLEKPYILLT
jgi:pyruvate dehydrogenase E2 component (dihydrolipoamide acetyltransferase)